MILKLEDQVLNYGASFEYINSDCIFRIRIKRKRIKIYYGSYSYIFVGRTEHNMNELKKLDSCIDWL